MRVLKFLLPCLAVIVFSAAIAQDAATDNAKTCLSNARQIALACKLYASDHDGQYPAKITDVMPDYVRDAALFVSPLSSKKEPVGYDYFGGKESDDPKKILLQSKDTTPDGKRIIVHMDLTGEIVKADK